jgi:hypothetical protein
MESLFICVSGGTILRVLLLAPVFSIIHSLNLQYCLFHYCLSQYVSCCCICLLSSHAENKASDERTTFTSLLFVKRWNFFGHHSIEALFSTELYFAHDTPYIQHQQTHLVLCHLDCTCCSNSVRTT